MDFLNKIRTDTSKISDEIYNFSYSNEELRYQSFLKGFSNNLFLTFNSYFEELNIFESFKQLLNGKIVNNTENQAALHHVFRDLYASSPKKLVSNDLIKSCRFSIEKCIDLKEKLVKKGIKNIVTIGIGGSYEGPKLLIEVLTNHNNRSFNHIFLTGPDVDEFNEAIQFLNQDETFFIVSSKSFSTDETLQCLSLSKNWFGSNIMFEENSIAVTSQSDLAKQNGFRENIIEFPNEIGGKIFNLVSNIFGSNFRAWRGFQRFFTWWV